MSPSVGTELEDLPKGTFLVKDIKELIFFFWFYSSSKFSRNGLPLVGRTKWNCLNFRLKSSSLSKVLVPLYFYLTTQV